MDGCKEKQSKRKLFFSASPTQLGAKPDRDSRRRSDFLSGLLSRRLGSTLPPREAQPGCTLFVNFSTSDLNSLNPCDFRMASTLTLGLGVATAAFLVREADDRQTDLEG